MSLNDADPGQKYVALRRLVIPNPRRVPSSIKIAPGDIISFEGNEGLHVGRLVQQGALKLYVPKSKRKKVEADADG